ncbi:hypothetical protein [Flindersiella endophytica]
MTIVIAAIVLVGALCLLNLLLTFGVLRRLREHSEALNANAEALSVELLRFVGNPMPEGIPQSPRLVGFFKAGCGSCVIEARQFANQSKRTDALAVVIGSGHDTEPLLELLRDVPTITDPDASALVKSAEVMVMPSFLRIDADGVVRSAEATVGAVLEPSKV